MTRVLLLAPATSYRIHDFLLAAARMDIEVTVGTDQRAVLEAESEGRCFSLPFEPIGEGVSTILSHAARGRFDAVIGTDDETSVLAATASRILSLAGNDPAAVAITRDKHRLRQLLRAAGLPTPWFARISHRADAETVSEAIPYPCVLKPLDLSGSRGVIRADDATGLLQAYARIVEMRRVADLDPPRHRDAPVLVEGFIVGRELALEGLLREGALQPLALFDKPDPLDGPFFEETLYVAPSREPVDVQDAVVHTVERTARAIGLREGPVHAEVRIDDSAVWLIDIAARSIGGLCSRGLEFTPGVSLEEMILRHALRLPIDTLQRDTRACGVMMIPIPSAGRLRAVGGVDRARSVAGITGISITIARGDRVVPLPEGDRYLGFIFAKGDRPADVDTALRLAYGALTIDIDPAADCSLFRPAPL